MLACECNVALAETGNFPATVTLSKFNAKMGYRLDGVEPRDGAGISVASAGDVNGDGINDVILRTAGPTQRKKDRPSFIYVIFGSSGKIPSRALSNPTGRDGFKITGIATNDWRSIRVAGAGDVNGDGLSDLIVGIPRGSELDPSGAGKSYVLFGKANWSKATIDLTKLDAMDGFRLDGAAPGDASGSSVGSAGDFNGDGIGDIAVGAGWSDPSGRQDAGSIYIVYGSRETKQPAIDLADLGVATGLRIDGRSAGENCGSVVASAGDVNGDGFDDIIIGSSSSDPDARHRAGSTYVIFGRRAFSSIVESGDLNGSNGFRLDGEASGDGSGASVASAGDFNGDGLSDILIGAPWADPMGRDQAGSSYIVFGKRAGFEAVISLAVLNDTSGLILDGGSSEEWSGSDVAAAGDFNGDGLSDVIIGARAADPGGMNQAGSTYIVFGGMQTGRGRVNLSKLDGANGFRIDGSSTGEESGASVAGLRDVNGDSLSDILIGARRAHPNGRVEAGSGYVIYGRRVWLREEATVVRGDTAKAVRMQGTGADDMIAGGTGSDQLHGQEGRDTFSGGAGSDRLNGGPGADTMSGGNGNDSYVVDNAGDRVKEDARPGSGTDTVYTALPSYTLPRNVENLFYTGKASFSGRGNKSSNVITGGPAADVLDGGPGADIMNGGSGDDTYITDSPSDIVNETPDGGIDQIISSATITSLSQNVEILTLGKGDINGGGNALDNVLIGSSGNNVLSGGNGADTLIGDDGNDVFYGETSTSAGDDLDTVSYASSRKGVTFSLNITTSPQVTGGAGTDRIYAVSGIENLTGGSLDDRLTGNATANIIDGGDGNDVISGLAGADTLIGGRGIDRIDCGADKHKDRVVYRSPSDSAVGSNRDQVTNFTPGTDITDVSAIDADPRVAGNQAFSFSGTAASPHAIWYTPRGSDLVISGDVDGDAVADFEIGVRGVTLLTETDLAL